MKLNDFIGFSKTLKTPTEDNNNVKRPYTRTKFGEGMGRSQEDSKLTDHITDSDFVESLGQPQNDWRTEWEDMPEYSNTKQIHRQIIVHFKNEEDFQKFGEVVDHPLTDRTTFIWYPQREKNTWFKKTRYTDNENPEDCTCVDGVLCPPCKRDRDFFADVTGEQWNG